jgi:hypothetical protein
LHTNHSNPRWRTGRNDLAVVVVAAAAGVVVVEVERQRVCGLHGSATCKKASVQSNSQVD